MGTYTMVYMRNAFKVSLMIAALLLISVFMQSDLHAFTFTLNVVDGQGNPVNGFRYVVERDNTHPVQLNTPVAR